MIRISNISFFRFCWKNGKLDWPKCARTQETTFRDALLTFFAHLHKWIYTFFLWPLAFLKNITIPYGSYNLEKVLNFISHLEKSLNSVKVLEKYLISLLGLENSLNFSTFLFSFLYFMCYFCTSDTTARHTQWLLSFYKALLRKVV